MPRKAPNLNGGVIEHRITLGDYERKMISKQLAEDDLIKKVQTGAEIGKTVIVGGAVVAVGTLGIIAYREAQGLIDKAQDIPSGLWNMAKMQLGLMSMSEFVEASVGDVEEQQRKREERKNLGILEYGFDAIMKFLLGDDMIWTKATNSTNSDQSGTNLSPYRQKENQAGFNENFEANRAKWKEFWISINGSLDGYTDEGAYNLYMGLSP
jgi:hypothetical protein